MADLDRSEIGPYLGSPPTASEWPKENTSLKHLRGRAISPKAPRPQTRTIANMDHRRDRTAADTERRRDQTAIDVDRSKVSNYLESPPAASDQDSL